MARLEGWGELSCKTWSRAIEVSGAAGRRPQPTKNYLLAEDLPTAGGGAAGGRPQPMKNYGSTENLSGTSGVLAIRLLFTFGFLGSLGPFFSLFLSL